MKRPRLICLAYVALLAACLCPIVLAAQVRPESQVWERLGELSDNRPPTDRWVRPLRFHGTRVDIVAFDQLLQRAPMDATPEALSPLEIQLPMPDGSLARFHIVESPVMAPELSGKYPEIKTYRGWGIDDPSATVRLDRTPAGVHAQILSPSGAVYIDPYWRNDARHHASYYKRDYRRDADGFECLTPAGESVSAERPAGEVLRSGDVLRTYRLACAATGEYTQFHGGTVSAGMAAIVTAINRINGIYESELAIRLVLVPNNDLLVYTSPTTDPYNNSSGSTMLNQNQSTIDSVIGSANYDIGHVFSTGGGGIAGLGVVCANGSKARGVTGLANPTGDPFYVDYVAHEIGHQFGANHTFNSATGSCGGGNRNATTAYEPGSGSTIMAYAGICSSDNLQSNSDPYFHSVSFDEIRTYVTTGNGSGCAATSGTGNTAATVSAGSNYTIPRGTPFTLTATGNDPDGDTLSYCWEQRDLGAAQALSDADNGSSPIFRSFNPVPSPSRTFPKLPALLNNAPSVGERLPTTSRTMNFRVTARDNRSGGGGVNTANMQVTVSAASGPFVVTEPNTPVVWSGGRTVTWNVAGTAIPPVNAGAVNILLSTNGGLSFPIVLAAGTPNDGSEMVVLPNVSTAEARIKVEGAGNIFFDISDSNFTIEPAPPVAFVVVDDAALSVENCEPANGAIDPGETVTVQFALRNIGTADTTNLTATLLMSGGVLSPSGPQAYGIVPAGGAALSMPFTFLANGPCGGMLNATLQLHDGEVSLGTVSRAFLLGGTALALRTNANNSVITIPATGTSGSSAPYPSSITVSGVTGTVDKATVRLFNLRHSFPDDVDILLAGPGGKTVILMSDTGGGTSISGVTLTFDDDAAASLPDAAVIVSGSYKPTNVDAGDNFAAPAPVGPHGAALSVFSGGNPNGTWSLFVTDDSNSDKGAIEGGWALILQVSEPACCTNVVHAADLAAGVWSASSALNAGQTAVFTGVVTNLGPGASSNVVFTSVLPDGVAFVQALVSQGASSSSNGVVVWDVGALDNGATAFITIEAVATVAGLGTNTVSISSGTNDPNAVNDIASTIILVNALPLISAINDTVTDEDVSVGPISFTVEDAETPADGLVVTAESSNTNLVAISEIHLAGADTNRTVTIEPVPDQFGTTTITVRVGDGLGVSSASFLLTVNPVNDPPVLTVIPAQTIDEGRSLVITNEAVDVDVPVNTLVFSLTNAPTGAVIDPATGVFTWTPTELDGPGTNVITVVVSDDGSPPLSDSVFFTVVVNEVNESPVLSPLQERIAHAGALVTVTNFASDPDMPANSLVFSLDPGAPPAAFIDPDTGVFTWQTTDADTGTTNLVTVRVTDDGEPVMSAAQSFVIGVESRPIIQTIWLSGSDLTLTWTALDGTVYRVQGRTGLEDEWFDLSGDIVADGPTAGWTEVLDPAAQRFFRIVVAD